MQRAVQLDAREVLRELRGSRVIAGRGAVAVMVAAAPSGGVVGGGLGGGRA